jgi:NADH-quinone oxidoreductase subunit M
MAMLAGCGLPGFANFVGEAMVFFGAWTVFPVVTVVAVWAALVIGAVYMLRAIRQMLHGPLSERWLSVADTANAWRKLPFALLLGCLFLFGGFPSILVRRIEPAVALLLSERGGPELAGFSEPKAARSGEPILELETETEVRQ